MEKIEYKNKSDLILYEIQGMFIYDFDEYMYYSELKENETYYCLFGEFYYCGLIIDSWLLLTEKEVNKIIEIISPSIGKIIESVFYYKTLSPETLEEIRGLRLPVEHLVTLYEHDDETLEDDIFIFILNE